jgi:xanthine permease XanP
MRKPAGITYGPLEAPPLRMTVLSGVQHVALMGIFLVYPVLIADAAGASAEVAAAMVSLTLIALALGTLLQTVPIGPFGCGFLCPPTPTVVYLVPALVAARLGGLPLVFGMTLFAGLLEVVLARMLVRMRAYFPPEIAGLVSLLVGIATGVLGLRAILGADGGGTAQAGSQDVAMALVTMAVMIALNVWARGLLRMCCVLVGLAAGTAFAWQAGALDGAALARVAASPVVAVPDLGHVGFAFDAAMLAPFAIAAAVATVKVIGNVTSCQIATDADWIRTDMRSVQRGVLADGAATMLAAGLGSTGLTSSTASVGLATATGVHARRVAYAIAAILLLMALSPMLGLLLNAMPRAVTGAALVFSSTFIVANGLQMLGSRLLDARRTLVVGLAIVCGLAVDLFPAIVGALPASLQPILGTPLMFGAVLGLVLNLLFRLGARETRTLTLRPGLPIDPDSLRGFMEARGAAWGARRDVIERASFGLAQAVETIAGSGVVGSPIEVSASFDEYNLDLRIAYDGPALEIPEQRPSVDEIVASDDGERRLAGYMLRQYADRVSTSRRGERTTVQLHFVH